MNDPRYAVVDPVPNGEEFYIVFDRESDIMPNFAVATFSKHLHCARDEAYGLAERLNAAK